MELLNNHQKVTNFASEFEMQKQVDEFLREQKFYKWDMNGGKYGVGGYTELKKILLREVRVPEVSRISDHVLLLGEKRIINLECKLANIGSVISQARDHLRWCDYSIIVIPPDSAYISNDDKIRIIKEGIGLWYWFNNIGIFEFILPKYNKNKDKVLHKTMIERVKKIQEKNCTLYHIEEI